MNSDSVPESEVIVPYHGMFDNDIRDMIISIHEGVPASSHAIRAELILNSNNNLPKEHIVALQKIIDGRIYKDIIELYAESGSKAPRRIRNNYKHHVRY